MILTHCGKLGDFLYCLPIAEWLFRERGEKTHWVLPRAFEPFNYIEALLMLQPHCEKVTLVDHALVNFEAGGQPYRFNPADYGVEGEYRNLGFRSYPNEYISAFYAKEHGLGYRGFTLKIWEDEPWPKTKECLRSGEESMDKLAPFAEKLPDTVDLLGLIRRIASADEFHTWYCGLAVLAWFAGVPQHIYRVRGHAAKHLYFPTSQTITWHEVRL